MLGSASTNTFIVSVEAGQVPLEIVQASITVPAAVALKGLDGRFDEAIVPLPEISVHSPLPTAGAFPFSVVPDPLQIVWSVPATEDVGTEST
jgi:hypothetical protein